MRISLKMTIVVLAALPSAVLGSERYVERVVLPNGQAAVVAEGDDETEANGSYTVRLYDQEHMHYRGGVLIARDGTIEDVALGDLDGNGREQVVVVLRQGPGVRAAQAFGVSGNRVEARSHVADLPDDADAVVALTKTSRSDKLFGRGKYHDPNAGSR
jgi:Periplasmic lysozyme inhibitor of I-type lysozyme